VDLSSTTIILLSYRVHSLTSHTHIHKTYRYDINSEEDASGYITKLADWGTLYLVVGAFFFGGGLSHSFLFYTNT